MNKQKHAKFTGLISHVYLKILLNFKPIDQWEP